METAVNALGMSSGLGFIHRGSRVSFVLDIADLYKTDKMIPLAFRTVSEKGIGAEAWPGLEGDVRRAARDLFRETELLGTVVEDMKEVVVAGDGS